jgi:hypothetical protein
MPGGSGGDPLDAKTEADAIGFRGIVITYDKGAVGGAAALCAGWQTGMFAVSGHAGSTGSQRSQTRIDAERCLIAILSQCEMRRSFALCPMGTIATGHPGYGSLNR